MRDASTPAAHILIDNAGQVRNHTLSDHLQGVAAQARKFATHFKSGDWAELAGRWHDLGKYNPDFQAYLRKNNGLIEDEESGHVPTHVDHSTAGAIHATEKLGALGRILAYVIAGHHAGLPDWEPQTGGSLRERLQRRELLKQTLSADIPSELLEAQQPSIPDIVDQKGLALWVRMLFSCLVDADFLDTEAFMNPERASSRGTYPGLAELKQLFDEHMARLTRQAPDTPINRRRADILRQCRERASERPGIFSLTVPTGGGKTLSGMAFALDHAIAHSKQRIIHVIPYTSIIEQTADIFRSIFGEAVIEHHSNLDPDKETRESRLATENWDAPIIVTTSVQFFESLFAARTSRCRKLHNLVNSVVIIDEAQLLPPAFLQPILDALNLLVERYGMTLVLSTATQPALETRTDTFGHIHLRGLNNVREIMKDPEALHHDFKRVEITLPEDFSTSVDWPELAEEVSEHRQALTIVNTRAHARELYAHLPPDTHHLSASMCGQHRAHVLAEIKAKLQCQKPVRVVSTQLVEAGVDLDFPVVFRALAGLDSIAQAAGRCNREGGLGKGQVKVFVPPPARLPDTIRRAIDKTVSVLSTGYGDPLSLTNFRHFFELFYDDTEQLDKEGIERLLTPGSELNMQFRTAAERFRIIEPSRSLLVRYYPKLDEQGEELDTTIDHLLNVLQREGPNRWLMRKLQRYSVNLSEWQFQQLISDGLIEELHPGIWAQALHTPIYDPTVGLVPASDGPSTAEMII